MYADLYGRHLYALLVSLIVTLLTTPLFIRWIVTKGTQPIRTDGPAGHHLTKSKTPTLGGCVFVTVGTSIGLWMGGHDKWTSILALSTLFNGCIGCIDDWLKITRGNHNGLPPSAKLAAQTILSLGLLVWIYKVLPPTMRVVHIPFFMHYVVPIWGFVILGWWTMVGTANATNLTDGLDGLLIGPSIVLCAVLSIISYAMAQGNSPWICATVAPPFTAISIFLCSMIGAFLGFLWFNGYPASIMMGDCGSMAIGGLLSTTCIILRQEWILILGGGLFVAEALSVILQVYWFKRTGKRLFFMAPVHHHFEHKGYAETKIVCRFWIIAVALGTLSLLIFYAQMK